MRVTITTADESEAARLMAAKDMAHVLWEYDQELREKLKYGHDFSTADAALEWARDTLNNYMNDNGIDLNRIWT